MITSLRLLDFKNFADESLRMGPFTVIVGANASGKSNVRDALRFLHGIGRGYGLADVIGGRYGAGGEVQWQSIRGAADEIVRSEETSFALEVGVSLPELPQPLRYGRYWIEVSGDEQRPGKFRVWSEELEIGQLIREGRIHQGTSIYTSHPPAPDPVEKQDDDTHLLLRMAKTGEQKKLGHRIAVRPDQPALTQILEHRNVVGAHKHYAEQVRAALADMRFLDLSPERMRQPAFPGQTVLGDGGENLPTVLKEICEDPERREALVEWTRELTPMDVRDLNFPTDRLTGRVQLAFREGNGRTISAYSASDGTLRFLAMLAALLGTNPAGFYVFEEIDNGIHPSRLRLLLDLIEKQTAKGETQVVTTTHSPDLLSMVGDGTFEHTSVICRLPDTDDAVVKRVADLPNAAKLRGSQGLGRLHASGWMEDAILFEAGEEATPGS